MDCDKKVIATFSQITYSLTVNISPSAGGKVIVEPPQPAERYGVGTEVTLTAIASEGYEFSHWSGAVSGSENPTTITMDSSKGLSANFTEVPWLLSAWWWIVLGIVVIGLLVYFLAIRRLRSQ